LYSVPGKGSFVSESSQAKESRKKELLEKLDETVTELSHLDVTVVEICQHIKKRAGEEEQG
ncbi:MAG: GntR family transcriptional regulator, partial [Clostridiales bacterium]|nr:GntR family transcriptional regulator [Clostridiales bacterium]